MTDAARPHAIDDDQLLALRDLHRQLSRLIAPATPAALVVLRDEQPLTPLGRLFGPVRLVRQMMGFALGALTLFVALAVWTDASSVVVETTNGVAAPTDGGLAARGLTALYLVAAAGLGAAFAGLFKVSKYVTAGTYDRRYDFSYWSLIVLGLIAGVVLALLIPLGELSTPQERLAKPLLALLGGFSAEAVHRMLVRMVETLVTLVRGDDREAANARLQSEAERGEALLSHIKSDLAARVIELRAELSSATSPEELQARLDALLRELIPHEAR